MKPMIGITPSPSTDALAHGTFDRYYTAANYVDAVLAAGGVPIILPPQGEHTTHLLDAVDGLLFSGGADIDPSHYHDAELHPETYGVHPLRDRFELELVARAIDRDMPVFCICRGIQVLNVALGGTLYQDLPDQRSSSLQHRQQELGIDAADPSHSVTIAASSRLAAVYGADAVPVNSFHHQGLKNVPDTLSISGVSADGLPEAVELADRAFVVGVQWHPELMFHRHAEQLAPFIQLVAAATAHRLTSVQ